MAPKMEMTGEADVVQAHVFAAISVFGFAVRVRTIPRAHYSKATATRHSPENRICICHCPQPELTSCERSCTIAGEDEEEDKKTMTVFSLERKDRCATTQNDNRVRAINICTTTTDSAIPTRMDRKKVRFHINALVYVLGLYAQYSERSSLHLIFRLVVEKANGLRFLPCVSHCILLVLLFVKTLHPYI